jgi:hypothetical protein
VEVALPWRFHSANGGTVRQLLPALLFSLCLLVIACGPVAVSPSSSPSAAATPTKAAATPTTEPTTPALPTPTATVSNSASAGSGQIAGSWTGTYQSTKFPNTSGTFEVTFSQSGNDISGTITTSSACASEGTIDGTLTGNTISFGVVKSSTLITFDGTINGDSMSGDYSSGPDCGNDTGTWQATRT